MYVVIVVIVATKVTIKNRFFGLTFIKIINIYLKRYYIKLYSIVDNFQLFIKILLLNQSFIYRTLAYPMASF